MHASCWTRTTKALKPSCWPHIVELQYTFNGHRLYISKTKVLEKRNRIGVLIQPPVHWRLPLFMLVCTLGPTAKNNCKSHIWPVELAFHYVNFLFFRSEVAATLSPMKPLHLNISWTISLSLYLWCVCSFVLNEKGFSTKRILNCNLKVSLLSSSWDVEQMKIVWPFRSYWITTPCRVVSDEEHFESQFSNIFFLPNVVILLCWGSQITPLPWNV